MTWRWRSRAVAPGPGKLEEGVDCRFQRAGVALDLGEEKAALERGQEGDGEGDAAAFS